MKLLLRVAPIAFAVALGLAACGGGTPESAPSDTASAKPSKAAEPKPAGSSTAAPRRADADLVIWADGNRAPVLEKFGKQFGDENGLRVAVQTLDFAQLRPSFVQSAPVGQGPDIIVGPHDVLGEYVENGLVDTVDLGADTANYTDVAVKAFTYQGKIYGLPYAVEDVALITNTALVKKVPTTFEDLEKQALALKKQGKAEIPLALPMGETGNAYHPYALFSGSGGYVFGDNKGEPNVDDLGIDSPGGIKAAQNFAKWAKEGLISVDVTADIAKQKFIAGKVPFLIDGPWVVADLAKASSSYEVTPIPNVNGKPARPFVGVQGFFLSHFAQNKTLARTFLLDYLNTKEAQQALFEADFRPSAYNAVADAVTDKVNAGFLASAQQGVPTPSVPQMASVWEAWNKAYVLVLTQEAAPDKAFKDAAATIRAAIKTSR